MSTRKLTLPLLLIGAIAAFSLLANSSEDGDAESTVSNAPRKVRVAAVEAIDQPRQLSFSGVTRAADRARLAFSIGGRLTSRTVDIGSRVEANQVLARLDDREPRNAVATANATLTELEARLAQTGRDRDRVTRLVQAKAATSEELEQVTATADALEAATNAARARLREAERLASEAVLRAPFSGTITQVLQEPGEYVVPGQPVVILSGDGEVELEIEVPESIILEINEGEAVDIILPAAGAKRVSGTILSVGRSSVGLGRLFPIVIRLPQDARFVAGMTAEARLSLDDERALTLPVEAVINPGGRQPSVFRLTDSTNPTRVERVEIEVLHLLNDSVSVRGKLQAGDRVVAAGQHALLDGDMVEIGG